jgi:hypothetical protein
MTTNTAPTLTDLTSAFFAAQTKMKRAERGHRNPTVLSLRHWEEMCRIAAQAAELGMGYEFTLAVLPSTAK